jgi:hypothetical protein
VRAKEWMEMSRGEEGMMALSTATRARMRRHGPSADLGGNPTLRLLNYAACPESRVCAIEKDRQPASSILCSIVHMFVALFFWQRSTCTDRRTPHILVSVASNYRPPLLRLLQSRLSVVWSSYSTL